MTILSHILGFPRIGLNRELKKAQEDYWSGNIDKTTLFQIGTNIRKNNWEKQKTAGIDILPVGDFAWYDHVLNNSLMINNIPNYYQNKNNLIDIDTMFNISRGKILNNKLVSAAKMTKWFNTNYHYIIPEFTQEQQFKLNWIQLLEEIDEALSLNYKIKPILLGPITYLWLGRTKNQKFDRLSLLNNIIPVYQKILQELKIRNIEWIQIDEPILILELSKKWLNSFYETYNAFYGYTKILLTTYFDSIMHNLETIINLPIQGLHIDVTFNNNNISIINDKLPLDWLLSFGVINGRNIWRADLKKIFNQLYYLIHKRKFWIGSSCSLIHVPIDLNQEKKMNKEVKKWFSFAIQKCEELSLLCNVLNKKNNLNYKKLVQYSKHINTYKNSKLINNINVNEQIKNLDKINNKRKSSYTKRSKLQQLRFNLPIYPTTTIGSLPQTNKIRNLRYDLRSKHIDLATYKLKIKEYIKKNIKEQENIGLDVLVHGEIERNDMVEYFSEYLDGFISTQNGWVQSYGSRCVKPPVIIGDISRPKAITIEWIKYAQSLTNKPVKGILTGPVTILFWSFAREDISKEIIAKQIALALRDEVIDLEKSGIGIIQIDEPALREGLPIKYSLWEQYLNWAIESFKLSSSSVKDDTQIHTHICYSEFNDIIKNIIDMDVDVITLETSKSNMNLIKKFNKFNYPNAIGPGIYDVHSPNIPSIENIMELLLKATKYISAEKLWINPDCGLKTRTWCEIKNALKNMVLAAKKLRKIL